MGRHSVKAAVQRPMPKFVLPVVAGVVAAGLIAGGGVFVVQSGIVDALGAASAVKCDDDRPAITVVAAPEIAGVLGDLADDYTAKGCGEVSVTAAEPAATAIALAAGEQPGDVWIPDGTVWVERMKAMAVSAGSAATAVLPAAPVASSPVVFAAAAARAGDFADVKLSWSSIIDDDVPAVLADPEVATASLAGIGALAEHIGDDADATAASIALLADHAVATPAAAFDAVFAAADPTVAIVSEHAVVDYNRDSMNPLVAVFPTDGTVSVGYPYIRVGVGDGDPRRADALRGFEQAVRAATDRLTDAGFRDGKGGGTVEAPGVMPTSSPAPEADDGEAQLALLRQWGLTTSTTRLILALDVSASMTSPVSGGGQRIDVLRDAARTAVDGLSGRAQVGGWLYSTDRSGSHAYESIVPVGSLGDDAHLAALDDFIDGLPDAVSGGTALYDTVLASVRTARVDYEAGRTNAVVIVTDGNDDASGVSLANLVSELSRMSVEAPDRPVQIILVGLGPDADLATLASIADPSGGSAAVALKPKQQLADVLVDAIALKGCRPDCG